MANTYLAVESGLELIPVLNKIDLPGAEPERVAGEIAELLGDNDEVLRISAKTGEGIEDMLEAIVERIPPPQGDATAPPRALIFDSEFDQYRGVVAYVRVVDGVLRKGDPIVAMQTQTLADIDDIGFFAPDMTPVGELRAGEVGYVITGIKEVSRLRVGDTLTHRESQAREALPGYKEVKPMVFCGLFPVETDDFEDLRDALREARSERRRAVVRARDLTGARLRLPVRLPRPLAHGHRARAARARVRPVAAGDDAERRVRRDPHRRQRGARRTRRPTCPIPRGWRRCASPTSRRRSSAARRTSAR